MKKLIKKNQFGGLMDFAEKADSALDGLGTWGKLGVLIIDPTGITAWKDLGESLKTFLKSGSLTDAAMLGLTGLGAVPMFGLFKSLGKGVYKLGSSTKNKVVKIPSVIANKKAGKELEKIIKECIDSKTISDANKKKIAELGKKIDSLGETTNTAEKVIASIEEKIAPELKNGGNIYYKYF